MPDDPFGRPLTLKEIAHALGCSERTFRRLVKSRHFPPPRHTPGGKPCWFERDIETYRYLLARGHFEPGEIPDFADEDDDLD